MFRFDGKLIHWVAARGTSTEQEETLRDVWPRPPNRETMVGRTILATIGAIGFEGRLDYGAIGTVTNLAARLSCEATGGQILVSARVAGAVEDLVEADDVGPVTLKGLARPASVWSVRGLR